MRVRADPRTSAARLLLPLRGATLPLLLLLLLFLPSSSPSLAAAAAGDVVLTLAAFFPFKGWPVGVMAKAGIDIAFQEINESPSILAGYNLTYDARDTECSEGPGLLALFELLSSPPAKIGIIGGGCSVVCQPVSSMTKFWELAQLSWGCTSPSLVDRGRYPYFFGAHVAEVPKQNSLIDFANEVGWSRIGLLHEAVDIHSVTAKLFSAYAGDNGVSVAVVSSPSNLEEVTLEPFLAADVRIVNVIAYTPIVLRVLCLAYLDGLLGDGEYFFYVPGYVATVQGWYVPTAEDAAAIGCTAQQMKEAASLCAFGDSTTGNDLSTVLANGQVLGDWLELDHPLLPSRDVMELGKRDNIFMVAYDSAWAWGKVLDSFLQSESHMHLGYHNATTRAHIVRLFQELSFEGVSGPFSFPVDGHFRSFPVQVFQVVFADSEQAVGEDASLRYSDEWVLVASTYNGGFLWLQEFKWKGGGVGKDAAPADSSSADSVPCDVPDCNGRGVCDDAVGACICFIGYAGSACEASPVVLAGSTGSLQHRLVCGVPLFVQVQFEADAVGVTVSLATSRDVLTNEPDAKIATLPADIRPDSLGTGSAEMVASFVQDDASVKLAVRNAAGSGSHSLSQILGVLATGRSCPAGIVINYEQSSVETASGDSNSVLVPVLVPVVLVVLVGTAAVYATLRFRSKMRTAEGHWQINIDELEFTRKIGQGTFGEVWIGNFRSSKVAIKMLLSDSPQLTSMSRPKGSYHPSKLSKLRSEAKSSGTSQLQRKVSGANTELYKNAQSKPFAKSPNGAMNSRDLVSTMDQAIMTTGRRSAGSNVESIRPDSRKSDQDKSAKKAALKSMNEFLDEIHILVTLRSPYIVMFLGACVERPDLAILLEYMEHGDLMAFYDGPNQIHWPLLQSLLLDVAKGMAYLHSKDILHLDLKSPNILLDKANTAKVADFGLAKESAKAERSELGGGSLFWLAPEAIEREDGWCLPVVDVYSWSIIATELINRKLPYFNIVLNLSQRKTTTTEQNITELLDMVVRDNLRPSFADPEVVPKEFKQLLRLAWADDPAERPSFYEIVAELEALDFSGFPEPSSFAPPTISQFD